jgi:hypothetical protein
MMNRKLETRQQSQEEGELQTQLGYITLHVAIWEILCTALYQAFNPRKTRRHLTGP